MEDRGTSRGQVDQEEQMPMLSKLQDPERDRGVGALENEAERAVIGAYGGSVYGGGEVDVAGVDFDRCCCCSRGGKRGEDGPWEPGESSSVEGRRAMSVWPSGHLHHNEATQPPRLALSAPEKASPTSPCQTALFPPQTASAET